MYVNISVNSSSSNSSLHPPIMTCFKSKKNIFVSSALPITDLLLFPLFILVLYLGYQQRRRAATLSHSDFFTFHSIAMQLITPFGFTFFFCGSYFNLQEMTVAGLCLWSAASLGQALFHLLTCVEHYLAVVHPIIYRGFKQAGGIRIRNMSTGCVWLLCFGWISLYYAGSTLNLTLYFCIVVFLLIVVSFCSISVLCALKRPGPGGVGGNRERVNQSKQRAFHTIMAIMGVLLFRFGGNLITNIVYRSEALSSFESCAVLVSGFWFDLPSRMVLPLLFLQRAGKLPSCKKESG